MKKAKVVKPKKVSKAKRIKKLRTKCWEVMSLFTRLKFADSQGFVSCVTCGKRSHYTKMNAGHFIHGALDYNEINVNPQDVRCNKWLHGNLIQYTTYITLKYGPEMVKILQTEAAKKIKYTEEELEKILIELNKKLESVKNGTYIC